MSAGAPRAQGSDAGSDEAMAAAIEKLASLVSDSADSATRDIIKQTASTLSRDAGSVSGDSGSEDDASSVGSRSSYSGSSVGSGSYSGSSYSGSDGEGSYSGSSRSYSDSSPERSPRRRTRGSEGGSSVASSSIRGFARPTPAELWRAAHETPMQQKKTRVLTPNEEREVVQRLTDTSRQRHANLMRVESKRLGELMGGLSFTPSICARSREYSQSIEPLEARLPELQRKKLKKLTKLRNEASEALMNKASFEPDMKTPCVCSVGIGLHQSKELGMYEDHTPYCRKFMSACNTINERNEHQQLGNSMKRKVAHLSQYDEYKRIRAQQRRQIMEEVENRELTFAPQINPNSAMMAARHKARARERALRKMEEKRRAASSPRSQRSLPRRMDPGHEQETFTPRINKRSRRVKHKTSGNVFHRLYSTGKSKHRSRVLESRAANAHAKGAYADAQTMLEAAQGDEAALDRTQIPSPRKTSASSKAHSFNTVVFDSSKHAFLVKQLHLQSTNIASRMTM